MDDVIFATTCQLVSAIQHHHISVIEVVEAHLEHIARHNSAINAIVTMDVEGARQRALDADVALQRGESWGSLHGIPVTVKDALETEGMRTTAGYPPLEDYVPSHDASAVARLRAAGAIVLGKTNMQELGMDFQSTNPLFGRTNNPWNLERTSGGSTGGGGAAIATGMTPLTLGADSGGSVRIPAHFCGVYALKPTEHRVPTTGHIPELPGEPRAMRHLNTIGPMARSIEDLSLALRLIAGPDRQQWEVPPVPLESPSIQKLSGIQLAWTDGFSGLPVSVETRQTLAKVASTLEGAGHEIEQCEPSVDFVLAFDVFHTIFSLESGVSLSREQENVPVRPKRERAHDMKRYAMALEQRDAFIGLLERFFDRWDALLCPVSAGPAFDHCRIGTPLFIDGEAVPYRVAGVGHCCPFNLTGHPVVVLPIGLSQEGLPIGVQVVGRRWGDMELLTIAAQIVEKVGPFRRPPGY